MSDKIAIINNKTIEQFGTPYELFEQPNSLYIANFLNRINQIPNKLLKDLGAKISDENVAVISIDKMNVVKSSKIKASILDISFCGDYYELHISLDEYDNKEMLIKTSCLESLEDDKSCYIDLNLKDIKIVKK